MRKTVLACIGIAFLLSACNTMEGAGQDIKAGGQDLTNSAHHTKQEMHEHDDDDYNQ